MYLSQQSNTVDFGFSSDVTLYVSGLVMAMLMSVIVPVLLIDPILTDTLLETDARAESPSPEGPSEAEAGSPWSMSGRRGNTCRPRKKTLHL